MINSKGQIQYGTITIPYHIIKSKRIKTSEIIVESEKVTIRTPPYPVKARTFADVTTGNPPIQYAFDLLAKGQGPPPQPKSQIEIPKPPLTIQTAPGTYYIQLLWDPPTIQAGKSTDFGVIFQDASKTIVNQVSYSFKVTDPSGKVIADMHNQKAPDGTGKQTVQFDNEGLHTISVTIDEVEGQPSGEFVEDAEFHVMAVRG